MPGYAPSRLLGRKQLFVPKHADGEKLFIPKHADGEKGQGRTNKYNEYQEGNDFPET